MWSNFDFNERERERKSEKLEFNNKKVIRNALKDKNGKRNIIGEDREVSIMRRRWRKKKILNVIHTNDIEFEKCIVNSV